jgi:hypothetical protein
MSPITPRRLTLAVVTAVATFAATAGPAPASVPASCPTVAVSHPFAPWGDTADYRLAPGGDVEDAGVSWSLAGGAGAVEGNESFMVSKPRDHLSLRLPATASATSKRTCIGAQDPKFRFFVKRSGGLTTSRLVVEVVYNDSSGEHARRAGLVSGSDRWAPSPALPTIVNLMAQTQGKAMNASFRFRPQGGGTWSVDDVYVDPGRGI